MKQPKNVVDISQKWQNGKHLAERLGFELNIEITPKKVLVNHLLMLIPK
jgi:hypothetical protein